MAHSSQSEPQLGISDQKMMSNVTILILIPGKRYCHFPCTNLPLLDHKNKTIKMDIFIYIRRHVLYKDVLFFICICNINKNL